MCLISDRPKEVVDQVRHRDVVSLSGMLCMAARGSKIDTSIFLAFIVRMILARATGRSRSYRLRDLSRDNERLSKVIRCPLYPQKLTSVERSAMSAERQKPSRMMSDYSMLVFALNLIDVWLPSQNGLFFEAPQRQTVMRLRISYW